MNINMKNPIKTTLILFITIALVACSSEEKIEFPEGIEVVDTERGTGEGAAHTDFVEVHYTGYLAENNQKFDSSHDRQMPFRFQLGAGEVISGWDNGLVGMKVGGKRTLTISPEHGYGSRGAGNVIPPNATLIFEVEMLGITPLPKPWIYDDADVYTTESGLQYVIKTVGEGEPVKDGDVIDIYYAGFFEDGDLFDTSENSPQSFMFTVGEGRAIPGWEEGIKGIRLGEERIIIIPPSLAYGENGIPGAIPPNSTLIFNVKVNSIN